MNFATSLKRLREQKGITQRELAKHLNMASSTLAMYEVAKREPDFGTLLKFADFFDVSLDVMLGRDEDPYSIKSIKAIGYGDKLIDISALSPDMQQLVRKMAEDARENKIKKP